MNDNLIWLQQWYYNQCDGDWEHGNGIKIGTIDNPGWYLKISLLGTELDSKTFQPLETNLSEHNWVYCSVKNNIFQGFGGPFNLIDILTVFRKWINQTVPPIPTFDIQTMDNLMWLQQWYYNQCDGDWEHGNGIKIGTIDHPGWCLKISLQGTELDNKPFQPLETNLSERNWVYCSVKNNIFQGFGGPFNLPELIKIFYEWIKNSG